MKKRLIYLIVTIFLAIQALSLCSYAASSSSAMKIAMKKYKAGNYSGCLQDCLNITYHNPQNALAYYYLALSYAQSGNKDKAIAAYAKVLALNPDSTLADYATTGKRCLETPDKCVAEGADTASEAEIDKLLASPNSQGLSSSVRKDLEQKQLNVLKEQINSGKDMDENSMKLLNDASKESNITTAEAPKQPTDEEIVAAMKVLNQAGINPYNQVSSYQNPQAMQLQMLQSFNNNPVSNPNDSNAMLNMIPMMMSQSKTGQGNYSPELMQAFIMNTLTGSMNLNSDNNENRNDNY